MLIPKGSILGKELEIISKGNQLIQVHLKITVETMCATECYCAAEKSIHLNTCTLSG